MQNLDPLSPPSLLLASLVRDLPAAGDRLASVTSKGCLSHVDCIYIEERLRSAQSAIIGLRQQIEHDKPLKLAI